MPGRLRVGTSGFAYPAWAPRFYPAGLPPARRLEHYATRLSAVELNNTFYRSPTPAAIATWLAATPSDFRFAAAVAAFGMVLRDSPNRGDADLAKVLEWAKASLSDDPGGHRAEFLQLVGKAHALQGD